VGLGQAYLFVVPEYQRGDQECAGLPWRGVAEQAGGIRRLRRIAAGARAVQALTQVVVALGMIQLTRAVHIPLINRAVSAGGPFESEARLDASAMTMLDDLFYRVAVCGSPRQPQADRHEEKGIHERVVIDPIVRHRGRGAEQGA
jgi:hypothetical protein